MIAPEVKEKLIKAFGKSSKDVGSCEVQVAFLSERIKQVSAHLKASPKDKHSQYGLLRMIGKRRSFLRYLEKNNKKTHPTFINLLKEHGCM